MSSHLRHLIHPSLRLAGKGNRPDNRANLVTLAVNWGDARARVMSAYRGWLRAVSFLAS